MCRQVSRCQNPGAPARAPSPITMSPAQPELCAQSTHLLSHLPRRDHPSEKQLEEPLPEPHPCRSPSHPGLRAPGRSRSSSLRQEGPRIWGGGHSQCSRASQPGQGWVHTPPGPLLLREAQKGEGCTPGSGRHPGSTASLPVLPDVIILVVIKGLDVVTAAGLKQSRAGLRESTSPTWSRRPGPQPHRTGAHGAALSRCPSTAVSPSTSNTH